MSARLVFVYENDREATLSPYEVRQYQGDEAGLPEWLDAIGWASLGMVQHVPFGAYMSQELRIVAYRVEVLAWTGDYVPTRTGTATWRKGEHVMSCRDRWDGREWQLVEAVYGDDHTPTHAHTPTQALDTSVRA